MNRSGTAKDSPAEMFGDTLDVRFSSADPEPSELDLSAWAADQEAELEADLDEPCWVEDGAIPEPADQAAGDVSVEPQGWDLWGGVRRKVAVAAGLVPLFLQSTVALAAPPTLPADPTAAPMVEGPAPAQAPVVVPATATPAPNPRTQPPAPRVDADPTGIWQGLIDHQVVLTLSDGSKFHGTVLNVTQGVLVCARGGDGLLLVVDLDKITEVHVEGLNRDPHAKPPQTGQGMIVFGTIATAIGGVLALATLGLAIDCGPSTGYYSSSFCPYYTIPTGVVGLINLSVGIPFLAAGLHKRKQYRAGQADKTDKPTPLVTPFAGPTRAGAMAGVGIRF